MHFHYKGALFSIVASLESGVLLVASVLWPLIFPLTLKHNLKPGMTYVFMAALASLILPFLV